METPKKSKSRNLSTYEFFQILQREWIVADLKYRICPRNNEKDRKFWERVKAGKKCVIDSIAEKNFLPTIFTDEDMKRVFESSIYNQVGPPNFIYKDESHRSVQEPIDHMLYFSKGSDVRVDLYGEVKVGKVKSYNPMTNTVVVVIDESPYEFKKAEVTRIF